MVLSGHIVTGYNTGTRAKYTHPFGEEIYVHLLEEAGKREMFKFHLTIYLIVCILVKDSSEN